MVLHVNKNLVTLFSLALLAGLTSGCGTSGDQKTEPAAMETVVQEGRNLVSQSDCLGCHKEDAKLVGPSYLEIANYYEASEANIKMLSEKIMKGGQGAWGSVPMAPHPTVSEQEAQKMVRYILSLKK